MARIVQPGAIHSDFRSIFPRGRPAYPKENLAKGPRSIIAQFADYCSIRHRRCDQLKILECIFTSLLISASILRLPPCSSFGGTSMKHILAKFVADESGATAIEYGLIAAGISIAILAAVNGLGSNLNTMFNSINTSLK